MDRFDNGVQITMIRKIFTLIMFSGLVALSGCQTQPMGNSVAFSRLTGDYWQVWTMQPDGGQAEQVTTSSADKRYPVWATNGQQLYFRTNNNLSFNVNLDTEQETRVLGSLGSNDGVVPSPDGSKLLLVRFSSQLKDNANLWLTSSEGKGRRILTRDAGLQYNPCWSPDSGQIAYICGYGYRTDELYIIDSDGKNKYRLTNNKAIELLPAFSPDGSSIAYVSDVTGNFEIWLMAPDGTNRKQLTDSEGIDTRPSWSPDGSKIMFASNRSGQLQIWIMNSDGSNPQQITTGAPSMDPAWKRK